MLHGLKPDAGVWLVMEGIEVIILNIQWLSPLDATLSGVPRFART